MKKIKTKKQLQKRLRVLVNIEKQKQCQRLSSIYLFKDTYRIELTRYFLPINPRLIKNFSMIRYDPNEIKGARNGNKFCH
jgi:hypothetical protein